MDEELQGQREKAFKDIAPATSMITVKTQFIFKIKRAAGGQDTTYGQSLYTASRGRFLSDI